MKKIFEQGEKMLADAFHFASVQINYARGGNVIAAGIRAKLGKTLFKAEDNYGVTIRMEQRDFIVRGEDLGVTPEVGDEIQYDRRRYLVTAPNNEPCWRWHTRQSHSQLRIHAKDNGEIHE